MCHREAQLFVAEAVDARFLNQIKHCTGIPSLVLLSLHQLSAHQEERQRIVFQKARLKTLIQQPSSVFNKDAFGMIKKKTIASASTYNRGLGLHVNDWRAKWMSKNVQVRQ